MIDNSNERGLLPNIHPGEILKLEFLEPLGITPYKLAKDLGLAQSHVAELVKGERNITALTAALLGAYFGTSAQLWTGLQTQYDLFEVERNHADKLKKIVPFARKEKTLVAA